MTLGLMSPSTVLKHPFLEFIWRDSTLFLEKVSWELSH